MKKLLFLLLLLPMFSFGQKIKKQNSEQTSELKDVTGEYCVVSFGKPYVNTIQVYTDDDIWEFIDDSGKKIKFSTITAVLNYMDKSGWDYKNTYGESLQFFIFKRKK